MYMYLQKPIRQFQPTDVFQSDKNQIYIELQSTISNYYILTLFIFSVSCLNKKFNHKC